jgi:hypothetical protein
MAKSWHPICDLCKIRLPHGNVISYGNKFPERTVPGPAVIQNIPPSFTTSIKPVDYSKQSTLMAISLVNFYIDDERS